MILLTWSILVNVGIIVNDSQHEYHGEPYLSSININHLSLLISWIYNINKSLGLLIP